MSILQQLRLMREASKIRRAQADRIKRNHGIDTFAMMNQTTMSNLADTDTYSSSCHSNHYSDSFGTSFGSSDSCSSSSDSSSSSGSSDW